MKQTFKAPTNNTHSQANRGYRWRADTPFTTASRVRLTLTAFCAGLIVLGSLSPRLTWGQQLTVTMAQQNGQANVQSRVVWFQNATRSARGYGPGGSAGYGLVLRSFETMQGTYNAFKSTLTPAQVAAGSDDLATLDAGLEIMQQAFANYQQDLANGRPNRVALNTLCQVLYRASGVWVQGFNGACRRIHVGWW